MHEHKKFCYQLDKPYQEELRSVKGILLEFEIRERPCLRAVPY
jgi:hypothetical protein